MVQHHIKGFINRGIVAINEKEGTQKWSIEFKQVEYDWQKQCIPQLYYLFDAINRIDITINGNGEILRCGYSYPMPYKQYLKTIGTKGAGT